MNQYLLLMLANRGWRGGRQHHGGRNTRSCPFQQPLLVGIEMVKEKGNNVSIISVCCHIRVE